MKRVTAVYSALGPVAVLPLNGEEESNASIMGWWYPSDREIHIREDLPDEVDLLVLCHEMVHVALDDSGARRVLDDKVEELICDAVGLYLAGAIMDGYLELGDGER